MDCPGDSTMYLISQGLTVRLSPSGVLVKLTGRGQRRWVELFAVETSTKTARRARRAFIAYYRSILLRDIEIILISTRISHYILESVRDREEIFYDVFLLLLFCNIEILYEK